MYPFTAIKAKESEKLNMKDILKYTQNFGVKNLFLVYQNDRNSYLKFLTLPSGPTLTFKIVKYCLNGDLQTMIPRNKPIEN